MYFANAIWYALSAIGFTSLILFASLIFSVFNAKLIESEIGYRNYFIIMGAYALIALPLAATFNGGTGRDFLFYIGCMCSVLVVVSNRLEANYKAARALRLAAQQPAPALTASLPAVTPMPSPQDQCGYAPAPASLAGDFDVPPQR